MLKFLNDNAHKLGKKCLWFGAFSSPSSTNSSTPLPLQPHGHVLSESGHTDTNTVSVFIACADYDDMRLVKKQATQAFDPFLSSYLTGSAAEMEIHDKGGLFAR
jgi:hypothetical protein